MIDIFAILSNRFLRDFFLVNVALFLSPLVGFCFIFQFWGQLTIITEHNLLQMKKGFACMVLLLCKMRNSKFVSNYKIITTQTTRSNLYMNQIRLLPRFSLLYKTYRYFILSFTIDFFFCFVLIMFILPCSFDQDICVCVCSMMIDLIIDRSFG